ncbi:response regulator transcription factor [candidate division KSB1 bacterium]|nr:response regulator transcription factor [candidate division KSB1 bacterium]NIR70825.1 response regulator transcription factor [candidate division KSB1 bacterium]NIS27837.1 response regulator transcription factor [candidate division KSB1 bacterium]NIT74719.1 response regulator transcription factor [candidate division KSB1 bacterium]NIU28502.1 response regulator transcription factor [candidate division KSB1 bacterium]
MAKESILIVEDEEDIRSLVGHHLGEAGYKIFEAGAGNEAFDILEKNLPDLIILDLMLPGMTGTEVCKTLKQQEETRHIPIIMLTAKGEEIDRVVGFELGADDYVTKPFSPRELVLRVGAILKRIHAEDTREVMQIDGITIDVPKHQVSVEGNIIDLTATEFKLLLTLIERKGRVQTRDMLLESVWGYDYAGFTRTVDTHMRRLRSKLGASGDCIETVRGVGYRIRESRE